MGANLIIFNLSQKKLDPKVLNIHFNDLGNQIHASLLCPSSVANDLTTVLSIAYVN